MGLQFDAIFEQFNFGKYQRRIFALGCYAVFWLSPPVVYDTFVRFPNPHRCSLPCENSTAVFDASYLNFTIPFDAQNNQYEKCLRFDTLVGVNASLASLATFGSLGCREDDFSPNKTIYCENWVYDKEMFHSTLITEFDLVCTRFWLAPLSTTCYMVGSLFGSLFLSLLSDRYGRRLGILTSAVTQFIGGIGCSVSPNFPTFLFFRFIAGAGATALYISVYVLSVEGISNRWRSFCGIMLDVPFALGEATVGVLAIFIRDWRMMQLVITIPVIFVFSYWWFLPESVRWLETKGREDAAIILLRKMAAVNKVELNEEYFQKNELELSPISGKDSVNESSERLDVLKKKTVLDIFMMPTMRKRSLCLWFIWTASILTYYGISLNAGNLSGNIFINFISSMLIEIPSYICLLLVIERADLTWLIVTLSLVGKFSATSAITAAYIYSAELYPTEYRSVGIGSCAMFSRLGGILAPFVANLGLFWRPLPLLIFGTLALMGGLLTLLLPETLGSKLPQTLEESETFGSDQPILNFQCCRKNPAEETATVS